MTDANNPRRYPMPAHMRTASKDDPVVVEQAPLVFSHEDMSTLFGALSKAQGALVPADMSRENPYFETRYADLNDCLTVMREPLANNGLALIQLPTNGEGTVSLTTILAHESGQFISTTWDIKAKDDSPQTAGSLLTYLRRYMANAIVGVAPAADDDDGARAEKAAVKAADAAAEKAAQYKKLTPQELDGLLAKADELFGRDADDIVKRLASKIFQVESAADIPSEHHAQAVTMLENQHKREKEAASGETSNENPEADATKPQQDTTKGKTEPGADG